MTSYLSDFISDRSVRSWPATEKQFLRRAPKSPRQNAARDLESRAPLRPRRLWRPHCGVRIVEQRICSLGARVSALVSALQWLQRELARKPHASVHPRRASTVYIDSAEMADAEAVRARAEARRAKLLAKSEDRLKAIEKREVTKGEGGDGNEAVEASGGQPASAPAPDVTQQPAQKVSSKVVLSTVAR